MTNTEVVNAWNEAFFSENPESATQYLSNDFTFTGPVPEPLNREAYMGMMLSMLKAFPDLNNNMVITGETTDSISGNVQMAGTHKGDFDLSGMGGPVIPPTGKSFRNPRESFTCTIKDGQITRFDVDVSDEGGLGGVLKQLGVPMP